MAKKTRKQKEKAAERRVSMREAAEKRKQMFDFTGTSLSLPDGVDLFKLDKKGKKVVSVIPYKVGKGNPMAEEGLKWWERTFYVHRLGPNTRSYVCPNRTFGKDCPVCEELQRMQLDPEVSKEDRDALKPKERQLLNVYDHDSEDNKVQVWEVAQWWVGKEIADLTDDEEELDFWYEDNAEEGKDLKFKVSEESFNNRPVFKPTGFALIDRDEDLDKKLLKQALCLDDLIKETSYEELAKLLQQGDAEDEDEDEKPKKGKKKSAAKPKRRKADEDDDEDEDEDDDEDSGDKGIVLGAEVDHDELGRCTVVKIAANGKKVNLEDEDEETHKNIPVSDVTLVEDGDEDDDDEDEPPKKKGKVKKTSSKKSRKDEDEDEDEDEEDESEDEDEDDDEEPPKKKGKAGKKKTKVKAKSKSKKKSKKDEDEDDDDEEEEEDDDDDDEDDDEDWD